ncbi:uncharacterized protein M421DRAFT_173322 [Didymella exigua CBS 183.55]|uniref:F-box domain-containing protein n=1 Tax=Didymella exigua CBS 183.55 TaxID=1150837 RepID=A0A6A5RKR1_9PLEO|nr:uncharacterized protein M421DRAFT_173322 [Didymella exigua CBS 183.55]KAF1927698.1 hypothetical protein M421DRAFT_173322 [Didymella exigua CBS 183.55]
MKTSNSTLDLQRLCLGLVTPHAAGHRHRFLTKLFALTKAYRRGLPSIEAVFKTCGLPPTLHRRKKATELASALEVYNLHFSHLHKLPWELILKIVTHISSVDQIIFKMSCRRYNFVNGFVDVLWITPAEKKDMRRRLKRDTFGALAALEPLNAGLLSEMLCGSCKMLHPRSSFTAPEACKPTHRRKCIGAAGTFHFCEHWILDFEALHKLSSNRADNQVPEIACYECYFRFIVGIPLCPNFFRTSSGDIHTFRMILNEPISTRQLLRADLEHYMTHNSISTLCPHTQLNDPAFLNKLMMNPLGTSLAWYNDSSDWLARPSTSVYVARTCSICDSTVFCGQVVGKRGGRIVAGVYRNLGTMQDPLDPLWLAHQDVQHASQPLRRSHELDPLSLVGRVAARRIWDMIVDYQD